MASRAGSGIAGGALWSLMGQLLPAGVGLLATPAIVRGLGNERFGMLALAWLIIGYFSLFDLGLGRAVTKLVAERHAAGEREGLRTVVWTAWWAMLLLGCVAALLPLPSVGWLVTHGMNATPAFRDEAQRSLYLLLLSMPAVIMMNGFRGVLEAYQRFALVNAVRVPFGIATFVVPLLIVQATNDLPVVIAGLVAARYVATLAYAAMCVSVLGSAAAPRAPQRGVMRELLGFGAWITVSNVVGPLMVTFDRFVIGAVISVGMVAFYATPFQAVMQFLLLPGALATVLFPVFARAASMPVVHIRYVFTSSVQLLYVLLYACGIVVVVFAPQILALWLGPRFGELSSTPMRWLMLGAIMNGVAQVPFAYLQGIGRSDFTAKLHLTELPVYLALLFYLAERDGIDGVALAWCLRAAADTSILNWVALGDLGLRSARERFRWVVLPLAALVPLILLGAARGTAVQVGVTAVALLVLAAVVWFAVFESRMPAYLGDIGEQVRRRTGRQRAPGVHL